MQVCSVEGCVRPKRKRTWCQAHYARWRLTGAVGPADFRTKPKTGLTYYETVVENGWEVTPTGCWEYAGSRFSKGYAQVKAERGTPRLGHRVVFEHFHGPLPKDVIVRHRCDNPPCVNPAHLQAGSSGDNAHDRDVRGRNRSHLTADDIKSIRELSVTQPLLTQQMIGDLYGLSARAVSSIVRRESWTWVA